MTNELREFLQAHTDLIEREDFNKLYERFLHELYLPYDHLTEFTQLLVDCGATPWNQVESIPAYFIKDVAGIDSIVITSKTKKLNNGSLSYCPSVKSIKFNTTYDQLPVRCFTACEALKQVVGTGATEVGEFCFCNCTNLTEFDAMSNLKIISNDAFRATGFSSLEFNDETYIGIHAFKECLNLETLKLGAYICKEGAFQNCTSLVNVTLTSPITTLGAAVFDGCSQLTTVTFTGTKKEFYSMNKNIAWRGDAPIKLVHCSDGDIKYKK